MRVERAPVRLEPAPVCVRDRRIDSREIGGSIRECGLEGEPNVSGVQVAPAAVEGPKLVNEELCLGGVGNVALAEWNDHARHPAESDRDNAAEKKKNDTLTHG